MTREEQVALAWVIAYGRVIASAIFCMAYNIYIGRKIKRILRGDDK